MTNKSVTLYIGITNDIKRRLFEHQHGLVEGFTKKYNIKMLVYFETTNDVNSAITREKQLKGWVRSKKLALIKENNPLLRDLSDEIYK
jgi:putative endonuclease